MNWHLYPNFTAEEFNCKHCGANGMNSTFMHRLQKLRDSYGKPMIITSGYRCRAHPIELAKTLPGAHTTGQAADIAVTGQNAHLLLKLALLHGFSGIGVQQKGDGRFLHLDTLVESPRPNVWSY